MYEHPLVQRLRSLRYPHWQPVGPGDLAALDALESTHGWRFPHDYRALVAYSGGGAVGGPKGALNLEPVTTLSDHNDDPRFTHSMPGIFVIGDDGGGDAFYYDPIGRLGRGPFAVFLVSFGVLTFEDSRFVGASLSEVISRVLDGEDLMSRPSLARGRRPRY